MLKPRRRYADVLEITRFVAAKKMNHTRWFFKRQGLQEQIVDQTENRGVQPDPDRERDDRQRRESGRFANLAQSEFEIVHITPRVTLESDSRVWHASRAPGMQLMQS